MAKNKIERIDQEIEKTREKIAEYQEKLKTLEDVYKRQIRECARAALMDGEAVADRLTNTCEAEKREQREAMERSLTRDEERIEVLDKLVMRLYEDMVAGRISEQNFNTMLEKTQTEQTELKTKVSEGRKRLSDEVQLANDAKQWVEAIQEYANITELDAATLNRLIKEIVVHERIDCLLYTSQLARRWVLTIPREIPPDQYAVLVREFCQQQFVSKGMCVDFAIHDKGDGNPHAHVMLTMRAMDEHGKWLPKSRKVYDLDESGERIKLPSGRWKSHKEDTVD